jgi:dTDP-4-dehydrorhamnose 3,5-epimerase-like enzyme
MIKNQSIQDIHIFPLKISPGRKIILQDQDHFLRRFGQLDMVGINAGKSNKFQMREVADEIFGIIDGKVTLTLVDLRKGSPSYLNQLTHNFDAEKGEGVLIPFGVGSSFASENGASLIKVSTHIDGEHSGDKVYTKEEIEMIKNE